MKIIVLSLPFLYWATAVPAPFNTSVMSEPASRSEPHCHFGGAWMARQRIMLNVEDCRLALGLFERTDEVRFGRKTALLHHTERPVLQDPAQTPRSYTHGTCRITVSMRYTFEDESILFSRPSGLQFRDSTTYADLGRAMREVYDRCTNYETHWGDAGWIPAGAHNSIGVFFWAVRSELDWFVWGRLGITNSSTSHASVTSALLGPRYTPEIL